MSKSNHPTNTDAGKTKQQLVDELNLVRHRMSELERAASGADKDAINNDPRNALTEIKRSQALLNHILSISADAIISIDENQCITRFNQGAQQTFGYRAQELVGESLEILLPEQFRRSHKEHVQDFGGKQEASRMMNQRADIVGLRKDGTTFPAKASISRVEQDGKVTLTVVLRDISEIRAAEQAARHSQNQLAHVTRIGLLGEISASLAHELNQPLAAILTNAQVLMRQIDAAPTRLDGADETISDVIHDVRRASEVVRRLKALSKPGEQEIEAVDLNQIVTETKDLLSSEMIMRQVASTMELAPSLPAVSCDRIQLQQILLNILTNSFDAMDGLEPADRHLLIRTSHAGPTAVEVCVKDSGSGFKEESCQRLFEPFYTTKESGMGMGLAISRTILQAHGGRLWAENNRGPGAAFYFTVPVVASAADAAAVRRHEHEHKEDQSDVATVFIVDDDPLFRKAMGRLIGSAGYAIETFASAQAFLQREHFDGTGCLMVDLHMPGETGLELQTTLNARNYTMPIIFVTGVGNTSSGVHAMKQGAVDFLSKPVDDEVLLKAVAGAVETDKQARSRYAQHVAAKEKIARLTAREVEIMTLVVKGMRNKQIAYTLGISEKTVKAHRGHVMEKVEAGSVTSLVRISALAADVP